MTIHIGGEAHKSVLVTGSHNVIIQAGQVLVRAAEAARRAQRDPGHMLRILAVLAAPVLDPERPDHPPPPLDLKQEWHALAHEVRRSRASILLARLLPPTFDALRVALSPRAATQEAFPHILHFSGHAWADGLLLEDELGQVHRVTTAEILAALRDLPRPLDLVVLNGCESAAHARSVAQALVQAGLARAAVGHPYPVLDPQAVAFAGRLYAELAAGFPLKAAVARARRAVTTHEVALLGDGDLRFDHLERGEPLVKDGRTRGNLPSRRDLFLGRGPMLVEIARALAHPPAVVVVNGLAGIGKSSLLLEAAHRQAWRFPGGVAFAEGPRPETAVPGRAADLLRDLAAGLGLDPPPGREAEALQQHTALTPALLVLDNLETLPAGELERLAQVLDRLGSESAALAALRPPAPALERLPLAHPRPLFRGLGREEAARYALTLAERRGVPLTPAQADRIAAATDGHPRLMELLVAQARRRDLARLLAEIRERRGDFAAQLERLHRWSAARLEEEGNLTAWQALLLFPAGSAPETVLEAALGEAGLAALQAAALADFDPTRQAWRWHATVADYARTRWPLTAEARRARLRALFPAWAAWLEGLAGHPAAARHARLEEALPNLEAALAAARAAPWPTARPLMQALHRALPAPDRTLRLRAFQEGLYRLWAARAETPEDRAPALHMLGYALIALGRREEALAATQEAADLYRHLAAQNPQAFLPHLAMSLNNLGNMLSDLGRREEALAATQEAVQIRRDLAAQNPQAFLPDLANTLDTLGSVLLALDHYEEAVAAHEEAVRLLLPFFRALPAACRRAGRRPDQALVRAVRGVRS